MRVSGPGFNFYTNFGASGTEIKKDSILNFVYKIPLVVLMPAKKKPQAAEKNPAPAAVKPKPADKKDPTIAVIIGAICMLILGAPGVGYVYIDDVRKGIEYIIAAWVVLGVVAVGYIILSAATLLGVCCFPVFLIPLAFDLLILWDVYLQAKGEPTKLPVV
jgi:TM2 domain-containing membrane protein YozV